MLVSDASAVFLSVHDLDERLCTGIRIRAVIQRANERDAIGPMAFDGANILLIDAADGYHGMWGVLLDVL